MNQKLSIIIPCFNGSKTIKESVLSCYRQNLNPNEFEIIIVDDKSTDDSIEKIKELAEHKVEIKSYFLEKNLGGGNARNFGIEKSSGDLIICLDSDDLFCDNSIQAMIELLRKRNCDGITFAGGLSFQEDIENHKINRFGQYLDKSIELKSFFNKSGHATGANFLYTRKAFDICKGYPINHNFDTQGFGIRFLSTGLKAFTCSNTYFFQRQFSKKYSYFERSYNNGEYSLGHFLILIEIFHLFSNKVKDFILKYDLFKNSYLGEKNIISDIEKMYMNSPKEFFIDNYEKYLIPNGRDLYLKEKNDQLVQAIHSMFNKDIDKAISSYQEYIQKNGCNKNIDFLINQCMFILENKDPRPKEINKVMNNLIPRGSNSEKREGLIKKVIRKIISKI